MPSARALLASLPLALLACSSAGSSPSDASVDADAGAAVTDAGSSACTWAGDAEAALPHPPIHTPMWAFEPWISKDISTTDDTYQFVSGFTSRGIPVGAVVLDSPWETHYNSFVPHPVRYRNFRQLVTNLHNQNIRLVLWITQFVNVMSYDLETGGDTYVGAAPAYDEGVFCNFYVNDGELYSWWKGRGSSVDFSNPHARAWFHRQQDVVLDMGIDGWKLDFGDSYVTTPRVRTAAGVVSHQEYSEHYYRDFLEYGVRRRGRQFVTMVRPYDASYQFPGRFFARRDDAPVTWVGDNRRDWFGLKDALDHMFRSAAAGYVVVGSDVGGYLDRDDRDLTVQVPFSQDTFARWTAVGALTPFMQLHGRGNFAPWTVPERPDETTQIYRYWATLHHALVPFFYSLAETAYARGGPSIMRPQGDLARWTNDYRYMLGDAFLVAPVLDGTGRRDVELPAGRWYDWWTPASAPINGGTTLRNVDTTDRTRIPLYVREGAVVPMVIDRDGIGIGSPRAMNTLTVLVWPGSAPSTFRLVAREDATPGDITVTPSASAVEISVPPHDRATLLRVRADVPVRRVLGPDQTPLAEQSTREPLEMGTEGWWADAATRSVWIRVGSSTMAAQRVRLER